MNQPSSAQTTAKESHLLLTLLFGNFVIGTGVMLVPGTLNDLAASLQVSVAVAGQLITASAITIAICAPLLAAAMTRLDRRVLLIGAMLWYAVFHAACALTTSFTSLLVLRVICVLAAGVFTPQAAAVVGMLVTPQRRGRAITTIFLGWSMASVLGTPLAAMLSGYAGWRTAFGMMAILSLICAGLAWKILPASIKPVAMPTSLWRQTMSSPVIFVTVLVTALASLGQFTQMSYLSPYVKQILGGNSTDVALVFGIFGLFGVLGSMAVTRIIDHMSTSTTVMITLILMSISFLIWPLGSSIASLAIVCIPWGLGCFACNSTQQARLIELAPPMASVSVALNTSAIYLGQGLGSAVGGSMISQNLMAQLHWAALVGVVLAMIVSVIASSLAQRR